MFWKCNWESECGLPIVDDLNNVDIEEFEDLISYSLCDDAPVPSEMLVKYLVESQRSELLPLFSIEELVRMSYAPSIREIKKLTGADFLQKDRAHCAPEQLEQLRKIAVFKDKLRVANYDQCIELCESAIFEICRRNDAELLRIYLDEFNGYCPTEIYDAVFDYFIYMYLPEWDLLRQFNEQKGHPFGNYPGSRGEEREYVPQEIQQNLLDILTRQAEKCKIPHPEVLKILLEHNIPSCREAFPIREQSIHFGTALSNQNSFDTEYAQQLLFYCDNKELFTTNCINPFELDELLTQTTFGIPVTCTCGDERCGGIRACSESWVIGKKLRLYIPEDGMYFFEIPDRFALRQELLLMLKHAIRTLQCHARWKKNGDIPQNSTDNEYEDNIYFLPYRTSLSALRKLCKDIAEDTQKEYNK